MTQSAPQTTVVPAKGQTITTTRTTTDWATRLITIAVIGLATGAASIVVRWVFSNASQDATNANALSVLFMIAMSVLMFMALFSIAAIAIVLAVTAPRTTTVLETKSNEEASNN